MNDPANIKFGNSFTQDGLEDENFDYMLSNPPFGVDWKKAQKHMKDEHENRGFAGRFGAGLPSISDGSLLFLQHMILINASGSDWEEGDLSACGDAQAGKNNPFFLKMMRSLGNKRKENGDGRDGKPDQIAAITNIYSDFKREVLPRVPDAWIDHGKTKLAMRSISRSIFII